MSVNGLMESAALPDLPFYYDAKVCLDPYSCTALYDGVANHLKCWLLLQPLMKARSGRVFQLNV